MLVLSRRRGQSIILTTAAGETIKITYDGEGNHGARLVFDAPVSVKIMRRELLDREPPATEIKT